MTFGVLGDVNWLAVIVATLAYFAIGGVWFQPFAFGDIWARSMGWDASQQQGPSPLVYLGPLVTSLIGTVALAMLTVATDTDSFAEGVVLGLVTGVGIAGSIFAVTGYFEPTKPKPMVWTAISAGYHLVGLLVVSVILAVWR